MNLIVQSYRGLTNNAMFFKQKIMYNFIASLYMCACV
jgi:hypothetical protein